jgi:hypothetical protein
LKFFISYFTKSQYSEEKTFADVLTEMHPVDWLTGERALIRKCQEETDGNYGTYKIVIVFWAEIPAEKGLES